MKNFPLVIIFLVFVGCNQSTQTTDQEVLNPKQENATTVTLKPEVAAITTAHGIENWDKIKTIAFTFNVDRGGKNVAQRSWKWNPQSNDVTMTTATDTITYNRTNMKEEFVPTDQGFINDKYWLLAPYQIAWDEGTTISSEQNATAPLSQKEMKKLTLTYGDDGGYTPGDAYDFYYQEPGQIEEWVFRKGNAKEPTMMTTFEGYTELEGLRIATDHKDKDGNFRLYFTDVVVTTK